MFQHLREGESFFLMNFSSHMSYGVKGLWRIFCNSVYFGSNVFFRPNVRFSMFFCHLFFRRCILSVRCIWVICPFGHLSFGHASTWPNVFQPYVLSVICLPTICPFGYFSFAHLCYRRCRQADHITQHIFSCPEHTTDLSPMDQWRRPRETAA